MKEEIQRLLKETTVVGKNLLCFTELDSTNTYLKRLAQEEVTANGTVIIADYQTAGRGRMERTFQSPAGKGIYLSVLLRPEVPAERLLPVTALAGVAVCNAVERVCGIRPGLKWPNDPVIGNRKLCGILTELVTAQDGTLSLVLGIGINVAQTLGDFSPDVAEFATSLELSLGRPVSRAEVIAAVLEELDGMYVALCSGDLSVYLEAYRRDCVNLGKTVQLIGPSGREIAEAVAVDEQFALVVRDCKGTEKTVRSGEVSVRGLYGYVDE